MTFNIEIITDQCYKFRTLKIKIVTREIERKKIVFGLLQCALINAVMSIFNIDNKFFVLFEFFRLFPEC
jgi:hypothetical protein